MAHARLRRHCFSTLFHLLVCLSSASSVSGAVAETYSGAVYVNFDSYSQRDPDKCDSNWFGTDHCDPYFTTSVSIRSKSLGSFTSTEYDNANKVIHFGNKIGQLSNPLAFPFTNSALSPTDSLQVSVTVTDKNPGGDSLMCALSKSLSVQSMTLFPNNTVSRHWTPQSFEMSSSDHTLRFEVWITCQPNYYQAGCSVHCDPSRFACSRDGSRVCPEGFRPLGDTCISTDKCIERGPDFCQNGGKCEVNLQSQPVCQCPMNFTGSRCELHTHPCHRNATLCIHGACHTSDSNGTSECVCEKGFLGYHCDEDVDECRLVNGLCGHDGECVNSVGSFRCVCKDGITGALCQIQLHTPHSIVSPGSVATPRSEPPSSLTERLTLPILMLAVLMIVVCALTGIVAVIMIYNRKRSSGIQLRLAGNAFYQPNSSLPVTLQETLPNEDCVESTYYEEVDDGPVAAAEQNSSLGAQSGTGNFSNAAYDGAQPELAQLTLKSRSFSKKSSQAEQQIPSNSKHLNRPS